jgi:hypothetical protein
VEMRMQCTIMHENARKRTMMHDYAKDFRTDAFAVRCCG